MRVWNEDTPADVTPDELDVRRFGHRTKEELTEDSEIDTVYVDNRPDEDSKTEHLIQVFMDGMPEKFWRVAVWDKREIWTAGSLDVADRKKVVKAVIRYMRPSGKPTTTERSDDE
jgi:hypothetical protein